MSRLAPNIATVSNSGPSPVSTTTPPSSRSSVSRVHPIGHRWQARRFTLMDGCEASASPPILSICSVTWLVSRKLQWTSSSYWESIPRRPAVPMEERIPNCSGGLVSLPTRSFA